MTLSRGLVILIPAMVVGLAYGGQSALAHGFRVALVLSLSGEAVLLLPGRSPFADRDAPGVVAFIAAYEAAYGAPPTAQAARGYNAARRIDAAVCDQGGVQDRAALRRRFEQTARRFAW